MKARNLENGFSKMSERRGSMYLKVIHVKNWYIYYVKRADNRYSGDWIGYIQPRTLISHFSNGHATSFSCTSDVKHLVVQPGRDF